MPTTTGPEESAVVGAPEVVRAPPLRSPSLRRSLAANLVGRGVAAVLAIVCVPLYVHFLGVEAYGLVGFAATLQSVLLILDVGLSTTLNRELARLSTDPVSGTAQRDLVRTLETLYWLAGAAIAIGITVLAPYIARHWVNAEALPVNTIEESIRLMGLVIAVQFPFMLYQGGLLGVQRQVLLNGIIVANALLRTLGVALVLWLVASTLTAFFWWQAATAAVQTVIAGVALWAVLPAGARRPRVSWARLREVRAFATGMAGIGILSVILMQMDKVVLSRLVTLERFGYYVLAAVIAGGLSNIVLPVFSSVFPRLSQLVRQGDETVLAAFYHRGCQAMSLLLLPVAVVLAMFAPEAVTAWTGSLAISAQVHPLVTLLVIGTALNGLMTVPYALQLAHGWTKLTLVSNCVAIAVLVPGLVFMTQRYGARGAATIWVLLNLGYIAISLRLMHRRLLVGHLRRWYLVDVGGTLAVSLVVATVVRLGLPVAATRPQALAWCLTAYMLSMCAALLASPIAWERLAYWRGGRAAPRAGIQR